jgi:ABC-type Fe3+-citrate transport system substrate-binding protein
MITSINEFKKHIESQKKVDEGIGKFFTGKNFFGKDEEFEKRKTEFEKQLAEIETKVNAKPDAFVFNKEKLAADAKSNNYLGKLYTQKGKTNAKIYVIYQEGQTDASKIAGATSQEKNMFGK